MKLKILEIIISLLIITIISFIFKNPIISSLTGIILALIVFNTKWERGEK